MADNGLKFKVSVIDDASKKASRIRDMLSKIANPLTKMTRGLVNTGRRGAAELSRVETGLRTVAHTAREASDRIAAIVPGLAAVTGLLSTAGVGALAQRWGNLGFTLQQTSRQLGMSAQGLQAWHYAAKRAGVTAAQLDQSMMSSQDTIRGAAYGADPQAMMLMNRLGVQISHTKSGDIDYQKTQGDLLKALGKIRNPTGQRTAADALGLGALLPMIQRGTFNRDRQQAVVDGYAPSPSAIQRAAAFRDRMNDVGNSASALANTIGDKLVPVLQPLVERFTRWLDSHRVDIAQRLADTVQKFAAWISSVNWGAIYDNVNKVADKFGGFGTILEGLIAIKFATTLASWTGSIAKFAGGLIAAKGAAEALKTAATVGAGAATGTGVAAGAATGLGIGGLLASPFGLWAATSLVRTGGMLYSPSLNVGENQMLAAIHSGDGKRHLTAAQSYPKGASDPKVIAAVNRFMARGWTAKQASGIVANLMQESHLNPYAVGDNGLAYGIGQWHPDRQDDFKKIFGHDIRESNLEEQEKFFNWELSYGKSMTRAAGDKLATADSAADAGAIVSRYDLRPRDTALQMSERGKLSESVYSAWQSADGSGSGASDQALERHTAALNELTGATKDLTSKIGSSGTDMGPTRVNYQMLGAMP